MSYIVQFLVPWTQNITLGLDPHNFKLITKKTDLSLNVILLPGCFLKTFIDIVLLHCYFYVFTVHNRNQGRRSMNRDEASYTLNTTYDRFLATSHHYRGKNRKKN